MNKHFLKQNSIDENQMKNKNKLIGALIICITLLMLIITNYFLPTKDLPPQEKIAIVTFFPTNNISVSITCEIASTPKELSEGLMNRQDLPEDKGMLFIYEIPQNLSFWMKNTFVSLDIIFLDEEEIVINVESADIEPGVPDNELKRYNSTSPAQFVVEISQGLSTLYGIDEGTPANIEYMQI